MTSFPPETWGLMVLFCVTMVIAGLHVLSKLSSHARNVHELRIRTVELRKAYARRMAEMDAQQDAQNNTLEV